MPDACSLPAVAPRDFSPSPHPASRSTTPKCTASFAAPPSSSPRRAPASSPPPTRHGVGFVRDLRDGAQNCLVQVSLTLAPAEGARDAGDAEGARELHAQAARLAEQANADLRELSHGILPSALARTGLAAAVEDVVDGLGLRLTVTVTSDRFRPEIESNVYFVVAEALTNMSKHARAQSGAVSIWAEEHVLHVDVRDDGVGGADIEGAGLRGIADRVAALGGRLRVGSPPGRRHAAHCRGPAGAASGTGRRAPI